MADNPTPEPTAGTSTPPVDHNPTPEPQGNDQPSETPASFDEWIKAQGDDVQDLFDDHVSGLRSALETERTERKALAKQIKDLGKQAEEGSELRQQLTNLTTALESVQRRTAFYESAPGDVANLKLAFLAASDAGMVDDDGVDWQAMRQRFPELFKRTVIPAGNAGSGAGQNGAQPQRTMNDFIRAAAGRPAS